MQKGMLSITFRDRTPEQVIELTKKTGLTAIEWGGDIHVPHGDVETAKRVGEMTREAGLTVAAYGSYYNCMPDESFDDVLNSAVALGAKVIRVWAGKQNFADCTQEERARLYAVLSEAVEKSAKHGITVATELHIHTLTDTTNGLVEMLKNVPGLKTYWQQSSYDLTVDDECAVMEKLGENIVNAHINYWVDGVQYPLSDIADRLEKYVPALEKYTAASAFMIEFVKDGKPEQFFADAETLVNAGK